MCLHLSHLCPWSHSVQTALNSSSRFLTVRNGDSYDITVSQWDENNPNVIKYAGIPRICVGCNDDVFHHQAFHFVYHNSCKFCRVSRYKFEGIATHESFLRRLKKQQNDELLSCHICNHLFSTVKSKNRHIQIKHYKNEAKQFSCNDCEKIVYSKQALVYHNERNHVTENKTRMKKCEFCEKVFHAKHSLDVHIRYSHNQKLVECRYCNATFNRQSSLESHYKYVHDDPQREILLDDGCEIFYFECDDCSFRSRYQKNLTKHLLNYHSDKQSFACTDCDFKTKYLTNLSSHVKTIHRKDNPYNCNECDFQTLYQRNLTQHVNMVHENRTRFHCSECDYSTVYKSNLKKHFRRVHKLE